MDRFHQLLNLFRGDQESSSAVLLFFIIQSRRTHKAPILQAYTFGHFLLYRSKRIVKRPPKMIATIMHFANCIPDWSSLDSVRSAHTWLEGVAIGCFAVLVAFDVLAHMYDKKNEGMSHAFERMGLWFFAVAVVFEIAAFVYGQRNDTLSEREIISLDSKASHASDKAAEAVAESSKAITQAGAANLQSDIALDSASNAKTLAAGARKEADSFDADIAAATKEAARLKEELANRTLTDGQQLEIAQKLLPFNGQEYGITAYWDSQESLGIANRIHQSLLAARWKYLQPPQGGAVLLGGIVGVQVWYHPDADSLTQNAARSLVEALNIEGISAFEKVESPNDPKNNKISISVGSKR